MLVAVVEGKKFAVVDRLAEIGRQGIVWKLGIGREEFLWRILTKDDFPGLGPLIALGLGENPGKMACAIVKFAEIKKKGGKMIKVRESKPIGNFSTEIGGRRVEIREKGGYSIVFYEGSEKLKGNYTQEGVVKRVEPLDKSAKESAKILRTLSARILERFGRIPMFYGFGKLRKMSKIDGFLSSREPSISGIGKALGMKVVPLEKIFKEEGLKVLHIKPRSEGDLIPLIPRTEKELVMVILMKEMFAGIILAGKGIEPDTAEKMLFEARGLGSLKTEEVREILEKYRDY